MINDQKFAIQANQLSKLFFKQKQKTFKEMLPALLGGKQVKESFWALKNINFKVQKGMTLGVIGANGSGKSTLLKIIAGVSYPTMGKIKVNGKIAPLIELGAGFHPELTGEENIFLNGSILGLKREVIKKKFQEIIDFAELHDFIDQPVKHYSSGMFLRLAFSVAIHSDPKILLVDEILAVGDEYFKEKCLRIIRQKQRENVSIVIVSHDLGLIETYCHKVLVLHQGQQIALDNPKLALYELQKINLGLEELKLKVEEKLVLEKIDKIKSDNKNRWGSKAIEISKVEFFDKHYNLRDTFDHQEAIIIRIHFINKKQLEKAVFGIEIFNISGIPIFGNHSKMDDIVFSIIDKTYIDFQFNPLPMKEGEYLISPAIASTDLKEQYDYLNQKFKIYIANKSKNLGLIDMEYQWKK